MRTSSLDLLERSELPPAQARAILGVVEQEMSASQESLATRSDVAALRTEMNQRFETVNQRLEMVDQRFGGLATKLDLAELRADMNALGSRMAWMVLNCFFGTVALLAGAVYFLYVHPGK